MEAGAARAAQILLALGGAYLIALWFVLIVWTFRDIESRSKNVVTQIVATLLSVLFYIPGTILYLILRPKETLDEAFQRSIEEEYILQDLEELPLCPSCQRLVEDDFVVCPNCYTALRTSCPVCSRLVNSKWQVCPYCATERSEQAAVALERVQTPAARWVARQPRSFRVTKSVPMASPALLIASSVEAAEPTQETEVAPIRLFDRRATKAAQLAESNGAVSPEPGASGVADDEASVTTAG